MLPIMMEPMLPRDHQAGMTDLAVELVAKASGLAAQIQHTVQESVGDLVRSMNCYYSNLIEGHNTHPRDIDAALEDRYSPDLKRRALQQEARAHIEVQKLIDNGNDPQELPISTSYIQWIHQEFCQRLPNELLWVENPDTGEKVRVVPGKIRDRGSEQGIASCGHGLPWRRIDFDCRVGQASLYLRPLEYGGGQPLAAGARSCWPAQVYQRPRISNPTKCSTGCRGAFSGMLASLSRRVARSPNDKSAALAVSGISRQPML